MSARALARPALCGMFELDAAGTVLYSRADADGPVGGPAPDLTGRNFFEEAADFSNAAELRRRVNLFRASAAQADSFDFICEYDDGPAPVRILLARIRERADYDNNTSSVLIHVRRRS
jgi:hypothetical protein